MNNDPVRNILAAFFFITILMSSCAPESEGTEYDLGARTIVIGDEQGEEISTPSLEDFKDPEAELYIPKVPIDKDDLLLNISTVNLDLDQADEQILVLKRRDDPEAPIRLAVVDFDNVWESYSVSWETATSATNLRTFSVSYEDIVGDHNLELICRGMNSEGMQVLEVFRKAKSPDGISLYYAEICSIVTKGSIEIEEKVRNRAYLEQQKNGVSFPIVTLTPDPESENLLDLIKTIYYWKYETNRYEPEIIEKIPGEKIEESQLNELFRRDEAAFVSFLSGPWYLVDENNGLDTVILFEPHRNIISYQTGDIQEIYIWRNSNKILVDRLRIAAVNELVEYIVKDIAVQVLSLDTVQIRGKDPWEGTYKRLSPELRSKIAESNQNKIGPPPPLPRLSGRYIGDTGDEIYFDSPRFTLLEKGTRMEGGYSIYSAGIPVLEFKILNKSGLVIETRTYELDFTENVGEGRIIRTVYLIPGTVTAYGFRRNEEKIIRFEQIETVEEETSD